MDEMKLDEDQPVGLRQSDIPDLQLESSLGSWLGTSALFHGKAVVYVYPATGVPGKDPAPDWEAIPGAVGCTVQSLGFKKLYADFKALGWEVVGISSQDAIEQFEFSTRNKIPFVLLSDKGFRLADVLNLPRFEAGGQTFLERLTLIVEGGVVKKVFHPVDVPADNAATVLQWITSN
jgi:peroxiredoxin